MTQVEDFFFWFVTSGYSSNISRSLAANQVITWTITKGDSQFTATWTWPSGFHDAVIDMHKQATTAGVLQHPALPGGGGGGPNNPRGA